MTKPRKHEAFTLIELLVVLGLIAVLCVLLFSGLRSVRASADNVRCVSNLRSIGRQSLVFFQENNGNLLPVWYWQAYEPFLTTLGMDPPYGGPASKHDSLLTCPAFKKTYSKIFPSELNRSYSANRWAHQFDPYSQQALGINVPLKPGSLVNIAKPSAMWMFMEGARADWGVITYYNLNMKNSMGHPHQGGKTGNAVFFDGHVEVVTPDMLDQPSKSDFWGAPE